jgi:hypothetical protein
MAAFIGVDPEPFAGLMAGKHENRSMTQGQFSFWGRCNQLLPRKLTRKWSMRMMRTQTGASASLVIPDEIERHIVGLVAAGNNRLARQFDLPLAELGYAVSSPTPP